MDIDLLRRIGVPNAEYQLPDTCYHGCPCCRCCRSPVTFDMKVTHYGQANEYSYNGHERIRISGIDTPELGTAPGRRDLMNLENYLLNKEVRVYIEARDTYHRIVGRIEMI